jgi:PAS domain S-box-containing protein
VALFDDAMGKHGEQSSRRTGLGEKSRGELIETLHLAMQHCRSVGWELDIASGQCRWFGDLQATLGIASDHYVTSIEEFYGYIHPDDRTLASKAFAESAQNHSPHAAEFRLVRPDGAVRWISARGKFYSATGEDPERVLSIGVDITDSKLAESQLAIANERLHLATESAKAVGWDWDVKSGQDLWFGDLEATLGITADAHLGSIQEFYRRIHPDDRERVSKAVADAMQDRTPYLAEFRLIQPDGTVRWLSNRGKFHYAPNGEPERMLGMALDVTERRQSEESLTLFRKLIDGSNDGIEVIDPETLRFLDMNEKVCATLGYSREELLAMSIFDIDPNLDRSHHTCLAPRGTGFAVKETCHRRKDGSTFPVEVNMKYIQLDRGYVVAVVRDITERKRAEAALQESEARLRLAAAAGKMYAFEWNVTTDKVVRSAEAANILSWMEDPAHETGQEFLARVYPRDLARYVAISANGPTAGNPNYQATYRVLGPEGRIIWMEESGRAFFDEAGKMLRVVGMATDATERKQAEEARRRREAELRETQHLGKIGIWRWEPETDVVTWSEELYRIAGLDPGLPPPSYKEHGRLYTSESWARLQRAVEEAMRHGTPYELDLEMVQSDGSTKWLIGRGEAVRDAVGRTVHLQGTVQDITERKQAERERLDLSARLITAQEEERSRIARELHDDLSQRLALLAIGLHELSQKPPKSKLEITASLRNLGERTNEIASDVHRLSSRLHPSILVRVGLVAAIRSLCNEIKQHGVDATLRYRDVPEALPNDVSMCLFRIAQEALANVVKHSGATQAEIELVGSVDHVRMRIADSGRGFDPTANDYRAGLGLLSMKERMRLVGGQFSIQNHEGTEITVDVPLPPAHQTMSA